MRKFLLLCVLLNLITFKCIIPFNIGKKYYFKVYDILDSDNMALSALFNVYIKEEELNDKINKRLFLCFRLKKKFEFDLKDYITLYYNEYYLNSRCKRQFSSFNLYEYIQNKVYIDFKSSFLQYNTVSAYSKNYNKHKDKDVIDKKFRSFFNRYSFDLACDIKKFSQTFLNWNSVIDFLVNNNFNNIMTHCDIYYFFSFKYLIMPPICRFDFFINSTTNIPEEKEFICDDILIFLDSSKIYSNNVSTNSLKHDIYFSK